MEVFWGSDADTVRHALSSPPHPPNASLIFIHFLVPNRGRMKERESDLTCRRESWK